MTNDLQAAHEPLTPKTGLKVPKVIRCPHERLRRLYGDRTGEVLLLVSRATGVEAMFLAVASPEQVLEYLDAT